MDLVAFWKLPPAKRKLISTALRKAAEVNNNPLFGYIPHPKQYRFHQGLDNFGNLADVKYFAGGNQSLVGDTLVRMADGSTKPIAQVVVGDRVVGSNVNGQTTTCEVTAKHVNGVKPVYEYRFGRHSQEVTVTGTDKHRVVGKRNNTVRCQRLGEFNAQWSVVRGQGFEPEVSGEYEEYALLLGILLGDGSCFERANGKGRKVVFHNREPYLIAAVRAEVERLGLRLTSSSNGDHSIVGGGTPRGWMHDLCEEFGLRCHAHEKRIPEIVRQWSNAAVARLLAGLFLTDGWVSGRIGIQLTSPVLIEQIRELLETRFGIYCNATKVRHYPVATQRDGYTLAVSNGHCSDRFARCIPLFGPKAEALAVLTLGRVRRHDARYMRYRGCVPRGEQMTYDLTVDHPDNLYLLANGIVTHNSGKTLAGCVDTILNAVDEDAIPAHLKGLRRWEPPFKCRVVTPSLGKPMDQLQEKLRECCPPAQLVGDSWDAAYNKQKNTLRFKNGSYVEFLSSDQDRDKHGGSTLHRVWYDEEPSQEIRNECGMRLVAYGGDEIYTMTPSLPGVEGWTEDAIWERRLEPGYLCLQIRSYENPHLNKRALDLQLAQLPQAEAEARREGTFIHYAGRVYGAFKEDLHVIDPISPKDIREDDVIIAIDPGTSRTGVGFGLFDGDDNVIIFDEIWLTSRVGPYKVPDEDVYPDGVTVEIVKQRFDAKLAKWGLRDPYFIIDPSARNKVGPNAEQWEAVYQNVGIFCGHAQNAVLPGISQVQSRLTHKVNGEPWPRIVIARNCIRTRWEFGRYKWKDNPTAGKDEVIKLNDDLMDCVRYICMERQILSGLEEPSSRGYDNYVPGQTSISQFRRNPPAWTQISTRETQRHWTH